jgi:hypothetical protein
MQVMWLCTRLRLHSLVSRAWGDTETETQAKGRQTLVLEEVQYHDQRQAVRKMGISVRERNSLLDKDLGVQSACTISGQSLPRPV